MKIKVKDFLKMLGDAMYCVFDINWNFEEGGEDTERSVRTDDVEAIKELFGNWEIAQEDAIYLTPTSDETVVVALYIHRPQEMSIGKNSNSEVEIEIICPQCGTEHEPEDDTEDGEHCCFYCGHSWKEEEKDKDE